MSIYEKKNPFPLASILSLLFSLMAILGSILKVQLSFFSFLILILFAYSSAVFGISKKNKGKKFAFLRTCFTSLVIPILFIISVFSSDGNPGTEDGYLEDDGFKIQEWAIVISIFSLIALIVMKIMTAITNS